MDTLFLQQPSIQKVIQGLIGNWNDFYNKQVSCKYSRVENSSITISSYAASKSKWIEKYMTIIIIVTGYPKAVL